MVSRGAKATPAEFSDVVNYLAANLPPRAAPAATASPRARAGFAGFTMGPNDKQVVDENEAAKGKTLYDAQCASCHGPLARGTPKGPDLVRSLAVLHDRYGSVLGPALAAHPGNEPLAKLNTGQVTELSHFLKQMVYDTLRGGPYSKPLNVLTGDPAAGSRFFHGAGACTKCHSVTGDLAHVATRYDAPTLQQRMLFPKAISFGSAGVTTVQPTRVTVTTSDGASTSGELIRIDDFDISLRDSAGDYHSFARTSALKVERHDPYAEHIALLDRYTDKNVHDLVAYLETLK